MCRMACFCLITTWSLYLLGTKVSSHCYMKRIERYAGVKNALESAFSGQIAVCLVTAYWLQGHIEAAVAVSILKLCSQPLIPASTLERPWQHLGINLFHFKGCNYVLISSYYSRFHEVVTLGQQWILVSTSGHCCCKEFCSLWDSRCHVDKQWTPTFIQRFHQVRLILRILPWYKQPLIPS